MIPYTLREVEAVISLHKMDEYHRELMKWLVSEVKRLEGPNWDKKTADLSHLKQDIKDLLK